MQIMNKSQHLWTVWMSKVFKDFWSLLSSSHWYFFLCLYCLGGKQRQPWISKVGSEIMIIFDAVAWENSQHFMTWPSLVSPGISYWWHITDLGSDASSVRKLYAHSSDIISWGTQWWDCKMYTQLCLCIRLLHINIIFHCYFTWDCFGNIFAMDWGQLISHDQQWVLQWALFYNDHNQLFRLQIMCDT